MEKSPVWKFKPLMKGDFLSDPVQDEFFKTGFTKSISDALVRETIQNSLDAYVKSIPDPVIVRFAISELAGDKNHVAAGFFNGIEDHIKAHDCGLISPPEISGTIPYLLIEDFNTRGLEGDPCKAFPSESDAGENFFYFWRNYGRSGKSEKDRGRWGLGKTVFSAISQMSSFYGLTIRYNDNRALLMGHSVLKTHNIKDKYYNPYGHFGIFGSAGEYEYFASPIENPGILKKFSDLFCLNRNGEPGLSIVVPFPDREIDAEKLIEATINQFFYPIMAGSLIVQIEEDGDVAELSGDAIEDLLRGTDITEENGESNTKIEDIISLLHFADWAIHLQDNEFIQLNAPDISPSPKWAENLYDDIDLELTRIKFDSGESLAFRVPVKVQKKGHHGKLSWFKVCLQRDDSLQKAQIYFIREGITITGISTLRERGIRCLVIIDEDPLTTMLGDAENPAHTEWHKDSSKFKDRYIHGPSCLRFVINSPREILRRLSKPSEGVEKNLLVNIFSIEIPRDEEEPPTPPVEVPEKGKSQYKRREMPEIQSLPKSLVLRQVAGGVCISGNPQAAGMPDYVTASFAYNIRKGNPFVRYSTLDFDLKSHSIAIESECAELILRENNTLKFKILSNDFSVCVRGFDENRDLILRITEESE